MCAFRNVFEVLQEEKTNTQAAKDIAKDAVRFVSSSQLCLPFLS